MSQIPSVVRDLGRFVQQGVAALAVLASAGCAGTTYVQPEMPAAQASGPVLTLRPLTFSFDRGTAAIDASAVMTFDGAVVGTFSEDGVFTMPDGVVWARMGADGAIRAGDDTFPTEGGRLVRPDGQVLATLDASGQLITALGSYPVHGISSRSTRLALFLYLVAATYAEDLPERASDAEQAPLPP